jgi:thioredoxin-like negative regulator of GroEL
VAFVASWCGFCARFEPVLREAATRHPDLQLALADISDDEADPRWDRYAIAVVPTVILFEAGQPLARLDGVLGRGIAPASLEAFLARAEG